ncbi:MAG: hypothetical protein L3J41_15625 [Melioribacteraceae bacterium]|nr:hypothetical protein [Melioribacteraceae bacterium]
MKIIFLLLTFLVSLTSCDSVESEPSNILPMPTTQIDKVEANGNIVKITVTVTTPDPCWNYYKTNSSENNNQYIAKIFTQPTGANVCPTVLWSFSREETIYFSTNGEKVIKFWQNDSTYLDTTIVL